MHPSARTVAAALAGTWPRRAGWLALLAGVGVTAATGGFAAAPPRPVEQVAAGTAVGVGPAELAARAWTIRSDVATSALDDDAAGWLVVEVDVTARTDATTAFPASALRLPPELGLDEEPDQVALLADGTTRPDLQPGLPARVVVLWPVPEGADPGSELALSYVRSRLSDSNIDASRVWRVDGVAARTELPRDDTVGEALAEEPEESR